MLVWNQGDWAISRVDVDDSIGTGDGVCLRHMSCMDHDANKEGNCSCDGHCWKCKVKPPDDIKGFLAFVKGKR